MKCILFILFVFCTNYCNAQKICFEYDSAGNQILREICITTIPPYAADKLNNEKKFFPEDVLSYYPNPVKEELFLRWELERDKNVSKIEIYNLNSQVMKVFNYLEKENAKTISFIDYPVGIYYIILHFNKGDQKSIKVIKK